MTDPSSSDPHTLSGNPDRVANWHDGPPDPLAYPALYDGVLMRRVVGYLADQVLVTLISIAAWLVLATLQVLTLGLVAPLPAVGLVLAIGLGYYTYLLGYRGATVGMSWMAIEARSGDGTTLTYGQALIRTALFYLSVALTAWLILLVAFLNPRRRCAHDVFADTVVVRAAPRTFA